MRGLCKKLISGDSLRLRCLINQVFRETTNNYFDTAVPFNHALLFLGFLLRDKINS